MDTLIVRRDLSERYYQFLQVFARMRGLKLVVDRRVTERRHHRDPVVQDRRTGDRRGPPPRTWTEADFIVVPGRSDE